MHKKTKTAVIIVMLLILLSPQLSSAFNVQQLDNMPVEGDLILGPGKTELSLNPGDEATRDLTITNRTGRSLDIDVEVEDFTGDSQSSSKLLGSEKGPYSLKDFIFPEKNKFTIAHGEKVTLPVRISIPKNAEPGGLYGAAIIKAQSSAVVGKEQLEAAKGQVNVISRLAELYFVRVKGNATESGKLSSFTSDKKYYPKGPVTLNINFSNTGRVHVNPYAEIEIRNFLGKKVDSMSVSPWFVMPGFNRTRAIVWDKGMAFGYYTADLKLHRGYGDVIDEATVRFFIAPIKLMLTGFFIVLIMSLIVWYVATRFEFKRKK